MEKNHTTDIRFSSLDLPEELLKGIEEAGFEFCTPIQAESLPIALQGKDVAGQAQTGTGKSAAFLLATFNHLLKNPPPEERKPTQPRAIMLAPTRELAIQIHKDAELLGKHTGFKMVLVYGGTGYDSQKKELEEGVDILIGTPGRIIDYFKQNIFDLNAIQVMVLDEADRMFDLGFIKDIRYLLRRMPPPEQRLGLLFSATLSARVAELAYEHMNQPTEVDVMPDVMTADRVTQTVYYTANDEKIPLLIGLLRKIDAHRTLVFINTKHMAEKITAWLEANGIHSQVLSGDVPQKKRQRLLEEFSTGKLPVMVATDVAARGLHIPEVSHVINFDLPQDAEDYVHRIGRTARAGASGDAISFACEDYSFSLPDIEEYIGHSISSSPISADLLAQDLKAPERIERYGRGRGDRQGGERQGRGKGERSRRGPPRETRGEREQPKKERQEKQGSARKPDTEKRKPESKSDSTPAHRRSPHNEKPAIG
jgi:ATP-dependent RNA helicase RhlB